MIKATSFRGTPKAEFWSEFSMQFLLRFFIATGMGIAVGALFWSLVFICLLLSFKLDSSGGFASFSPGNTELDFLKAGVITGAIHGLLIVIGINVSRTDTTFSGLLAGTLATEAGLTVGVILIFNLYPAQFKTHSIFETLTNGILWILIGSAVFILPTIFLSYLIGRIQSATISKIADPL